MYPNPVIDVLTVSTNATIENIGVYNLVGELLLETKDSEIDFTSFAAGMYILQIQHENGAVVMKQVLKK